jgi:hypothetical protein
LNNPFRYVDPSGEVFVLDDAIIIGVMAYLGGVMANFMHSAQNSTNPFNPGGWNWKSANTYIGIVGGGIGGAAMAGYSIPYTQVPGMLSNGLLQAGGQVVLNGIGNVTEYRNFFHNWYWAAGIGFVLGLKPGYDLFRVC